MNKRIRIFFRLLPLLLFAGLQIQCSIDSSRLERTEITVCDTIQKEVYDAIKSEILNKSNAKLIVLESNMKVKYISKLGLAGTVNNPKIVINNQAFRFSITNPRLYAVDSTYIYHPKEFLSYFDKLDYITLIRYRYRQSK